MSGPNDLERMFLRAGSLVFVLASISACRCGGETPNVGDAAAIWTTAEPFGLADDSMTDAECIAAGFAPHDRNWGSDDLREAATHLERTAHQSPGRLPRYGSSRSGRVFARMVSRENLAVFADSSVPIAIRLPAAAEFSSALRAIIEVYSAALRERRVSGSDLVELYGAQLRTCRVVLLLLDEFLVTLPKADPTYAARMGLLEKMRDGLNGMVLSAVRVLSEPRFYGLPARRKLLDCCNETFGEIVPRLTVASRQALLDTLNGEAQDPHLEPLQPQLDMLRQKVTAVVAARQGGQ
jgi:hypothetical protein